MHQLVPPYILGCYTAGNLHGDFPAVGLFVDISGFSSMTDALMARGHHGAEMLAEILRGVLDPVIESIFAYGGFVASSAGDAITAVFAEDAHPAGASLRALAAARDIQEHMRARGVYPTEFQTFEVSAKVGLADGSVRYGVILSDDRARGVYYFEGTAVEQCAAAEHAASAGEIIVNAGVFLKAEGFIAAEPVGPYYRVRQFQGAFPQRRPVPLPTPDLETMALFYPASLLAQADTGEFRQVVSMFISLPSVRTETQLKIFVESLFALQDTYGGLLERLDFGDKGTNLLLFWGAPAAHENDIERALNFILDLQTLTSIPISAGITYRISHAGFIGGRLHEEYTCSGRGVNLAARFMTAAARGEIWVDEPIARQAARHFKLEPLEEMTFKGFSQPQKVFLLLEREEEQKRAFGGVLAGREADIDRLRAFVLPILRGETAGMMVISGEPGIGKSRLVHAFLEMLSLEHAGEFQSFHGQSDEILRRSLNPFVSWLRQYFHVSDTQVEARNKRSFNRTLDEIITAADRELADELDRTRSFLGALVGLRWPDSLYEQLDPSGRYQNTFIALVTLIQAESLRAPVILVLEDIHWLDDDSRAFLIQLNHILAVRNERAYPVAVLATSRYREPGAAGEDSPIHELHLQGIDRQSLKALAAYQLEAPPTESLLAFLEKRAGGNPFYAEQILRYLQEEDLLETDRGEWKIRPGKIDAVPVEVNALLVSRIDKLTQQVKAVVQTASILGQEFEVGLLSAMLREAEEPLRLELRAAEQDAIWTAISEIRYIFRHALLREAAYQMQVHTRRKSLHRLAFEACEKVYAASLPDHYGELAYHAEQAGMHEQARQSLQLAGKAAFDAFQNHLAIDYFSRALAVTPANSLDQRFDLLMARENVFYRLGDTASAQRDLAALAEMLPELHDPHKTVKIRLEQALHALSAGRYDEADQFARQAQALAGSERLVEEAAHAYRILAISALRQARLDLAADFGGKCLELSRAAGSHKQELLALNNLGLLAMDQGKHTSARAYLSEALEIAREIGSPIHLVAPLNNLGRVAGMQGDLIAAQEYYAQALDISRKIGDRESEGIALGNLGFIAGNLGEYPKARSFIERYLQIARETGNPYLEAYGLINLSATQGTLGDAGTAQEYALEAHRLAQKVGDRSGEAWALTNLGHSRLALGAFAAAAEAYAAALSIRQELAQPELAAEPAAGLARCALERGDAGAASTHLEPILAHLDGGGTFDGCDEPLRIYLTCYLVLAQAGSPRAANLLETGCRLLSERAANIPAEETRQAFLNIPHHREIRAAWVRLHGSE